jgi:hypothetical protein
LLGIEHRLKLLLLAEAGDDRRLSADGYLEPPRTGRARESWRRWRRERVDRRPEGRELSA